MRTLLIAAAAAVTLVLAGPAAALAPYPKYYEWKNKAAGNGKKYYWRDYYYAKQKYHRVYYYPSYNRKYYYYYNPESKKYWGRLEIGTENYQMLEGDNRKEKFEDIREETFEKAKKIGDIVIPGSDDGLKMTLPPKDDHPKDE
jgi:hypothetical protein